MNRASAASRRKHGSEAPAFALEDPIELLPRVGFVRAAALRERGIETLADLLNELPIRHQARPPSRSIESAILAARAGDPRSVVRGVVNSYRSGRRRGSPSRLSISDATGSIEVVAFQIRRVPSWMKRGQEIVVEGRVETEPNAIRIVAAHCAAPEEDGDAGSPRPIYDLPPSIPPREFARWIRICLPLTDAVFDPRQPHDLAALGLPSLSSALRAMHAPRDSREIEPARRRFALEELAIRVAPLVIRKRALDRIDKGRSLRLTSEQRARLLGLLPFSPTCDQREAFSAIVDDLERKRPMHRLLQGEVGSGKTAVALCALLAVARAGFPCALLAPTAPLVRQHVESARALFEPSGIQVHELSSAVSVADRRATIERLRVSHPCLVVGTLRILSAIRGVAFAVIDEQQRFGVSQRARLRTDPTVDLLVMTATPIPRSLALVLYGDLDVTVMRELPAGRGARTTHSLALEDGLAWRTWVADESARGGKTFVICPSICGDDGLSVESVARTLRAKLGSDAIATAHGALSSEQNAMALESFRKGRARVLVSTVLLEVGIDVPDATMIVVLGGERFGLAQLHQLRGRVGRGPNPSRCLLVTATDGESARERIAALVRSDSGFEIAEADLKLRGSGELAGEAQHGAVDFRQVRLPVDLDLIPAALALDPIPSRRRHRLETAGWAAIGPG